MINALHRHQRRVRLDEPFTEDALQSLAYDGISTNEAGTGGTYSLDEVRQILENYGELYVGRTTIPGSIDAPSRRQRSSAGHALVSPRLLDVDRALQRLKPKQYQAVELCSIWGLTLREAAGVLRVAFSRRLSRSS